MELIGRRLAAAIRDLAMEQALAATHEMLDSGIGPMRIAEYARQGMEEVGRLYERKDLYLSGLMMSGEIFNMINELLEPFLLGNCSDAEPLGPVVLGAPLGDVHDIGKNLISMLLRCSGFKVIDLGVSVAPPRFVDAALETGARIFGLSTLITPAFEAIHETIACFKDAGLRSEVKIMLGGGAISGRVCEYLEADAYGRNAMEAVELAKGFI